MAGIALRSKQAFQPASYLGVSTPFMFAFRRASQGACHFPRVPVRWPELHSHAARLATTLQGFLSLSLKAVSHTFPLVSSVFLAFPKISFASFFFHLPFLSLRPISHTFPLVSSVFLLLPKTFLGNFLGWLLCFLGRGRAPRPDLENSLDFSSNCWMLPRPRASTGRAGGARGEGRPRPKDR